jgi:uncharacterized phage protein gp47/JayE
MADDKQVIQERLLSSISSEYDKSIGSFFYDATKPVSIELENAYKSIDSIKDARSIDTAVEEDLTELCYENGTFRKGATKAIRKGIFNIEISIDSRFSATDGNIYVVLEKITDFEYKLECQESGEIGNIYVGPITSIEYIEGLTSASLTDVITYGVGEETDDQLRERYKQKLNDPPQDGNIAQYKKWAESFDDIGVIKVFPLWNGGNTVKVAITNRLFQVADSTLVNAFQEYLDPESQGLGNGFAPIGAKVTVSGGLRKDINVSGNIILAEGYTEPEGIAAAVSSYLASITYNKNSVSYMRTAVAIIDAPSIVDLNNFTINGSTTDILLEGEEIPTLNSINLVVS